ncbi:MAG: ABC-F family ATP-binding cassette domain-containing protein [Ignavibacteria bacterium]|jgi:ATP-binding cassette subfamily F protein uup|nr:ABC-F family ATP-binding cassette domain-containing protein [Ignavibacteria bacterium]
MTIFSCNGLTKSYNDKILFENIAFGMDTGDKIGIIGKNGIGKTTLMKIIAGIETQDVGDMVFNSQIRYEYLDQMPIFNSNDTALDYVMSSKPELMAWLEEHRLLSKSANPDAVKINLLAHQIEEVSGWNFENEAKKMLSQLGIEEFHKDVNHLSGGLKKRVALARSLLSNPDLLILDEPTNHLDADSVQWLQDRLQSSGTSLLFVTHDRYFLDAVANKILEIDQQKIFTYPGSFEQYLEMKEAFLKSQEATKIHTLSRLRVELAWLQRGAKARRSKQKSRIDWVQELAKSVNKVEEKKIKIELGNKFLGSRIIEAHNIGTSIGGKLLFQNVTYIAKPKDRIGIIGPNGSGKSTFLSVLAGIRFPDKGRCEIGMSADIGYFHQEIKDLNPTQSVIEALKEIAEYIDVGIGRDRFITTRDLLDKFAFPRYQHTSLISTLSGGEMRRLALCRVLMANPNVLLLDEPTNDFDLQTLAALEEYLDDFLGVLLIVSHDRSFLDRTVNFIWAFNGSGNVKEYPGNYSNYLERKEKEKRAARSDAPEKQVKPKNDNPKKKLSYMEQRELDTLEVIIPEMEAKKAAIELEIQTTADYKQIEQLSVDLQTLSNDIDVATVRWLELSSF